MFYILGGEKRFVVIEVDVIVVCLLNLDGIYSVEVGLKPTNLNILSADEFDEKLDFDIVKVGILELITVILGTSDLFDED